MAEQNENNDKKQGKKKGLPLKTGLILALVLVVEVIGAGGLWWALGGPPSAKADNAAKDSAAKAEQPVELQLLKDRFQNTRTGRPYLYETDLYVVVAQKNVPYVKKRIKDIKALLTTDVATIFRRADPSYFHEPTLSTLTRQIQADLDKRFGHDVDGKPYIQNVLIQQLTEYANM